MPIGRKRKRKKKHLTYYLLLEIDVVRGLRFLAFWRWKWRGKYRIARTWTNRFFHKDLTKWVIVSLIIMSFTACVRRARNFKNFAPEFARNCKELQGTARNCKELQGTAPNALVSVRERYVDRATKLETNVAKRFSFLRHISRSTWSIIFVNWTLAALKLCLAIRKFLTSIVSKLVEKIATLYWRICWNRLSSPIFDYSSLLIRWRILATSMTSSGEFTLQIPGNPETNCYSCFLPVFWIIKPT